MSPVIIKESKKIENIGILIIARKNDKFGFYGFTCGTPPPNLSLEQVQIKMTDILFV